MRAAAALALAIAAVLSTADATAQCGAKRSTCAACHDGARATFSRDATWHADHAFADLCASCHRGNPEEAAMAGAHAGLASPLAAGGGTCAECHADGAGRAKVYRAELEATSSSPPSGPAPSSGHGTVAPATSRPSVRPVDLIACVAGAVVVAFLARRSPRVGSAIEVLRRPAWSPYLGGALLGLVVAISMSVFGHRLSGAGAYQHLSGVIGARLAPGSVYWGHVVPTGFTWDVAVGVGALAGAFVSSRLSRTFALRTMPDRGWTEVFGASVALRWAVAFGGSLLTELGGGIAGGCTASLAVSGGATLAPGAFLFMIGMFAGGIPALAIATWLARRRG